MYKKVMSKKWKIVMAWTLAIVMQLTNVLPMGLTYGVESNGSGQAEQTTSPSAIYMRRGSGPIDDSEMNITDFKFEVDSKDEIKFPGDDNGNFELELGVGDIKSTFDMSFNFSLDRGHSVKPGDYYDLKFPDAFNLTIEGNGEIKDPQSGEFIASYEIMDIEEGTRIVRFTFGENIVNESDQGQPVNNGFFHLSWVLGKIEIDENLKVEYEFNVGGEKTLKIIIDSGIKEEIKKYETKHEKNADTIKWSVDINKAMDDIGNKKLKDSMAQQIVGSIEVYELIPNVDSDNGKINFTQGQKLTEENGYNIILSPEDDNIIEFQEGNKKAYHIKYETKITDDQKEKFFKKELSQISNTVELNGSSDTRYVKLDFDEPIEKKNDGLNMDGKIEWTVTVNSDERDISAGVKIIDRLTIDGTSKDENLMQFDSAIKIKPNGNNELEKVVETPGAGQYTVEVVGQVLTITFKPRVGDVKKPHTITYTTFDDVIDKGYTVKNEAWISYEEENNNASYPAESEASVTPNMISKKSGVIDYDKKTITWTITFNSSSYDGLDPVTITDKFEENKYLKLYAGDFTEIDDRFTLKLDKGQNDEKGSYTLTGFTLESKELINSEAKFSYKTYFDPTTPYGDNNDVTNTATVVWGKGDIKDYENKAEDTVKFNPFTKNNGDKQGTYNPKDKSITWEVDINYNKHILDGAKVIDTFGDKQTMKDIFTDDAIKVYKLTLPSDGSRPDTGNELLGVDKYKISKLGRDEDKENDYTGFQLTFDEVITDPYRIVYTTKFKNQFIGDFKDTGNQQARNTAELYVKDSKEPLSTLSKDIKITNAGEYMNKDGRDISRKDYLEWTLRVNESQSYIQAGSTIKDILNDGQVLVEDFKDLTQGDFDNKVILPEEGAFRISRRDYKNGSQLIPLTKSQIKTLFDIKLNPDEQPGFIITLNKPIENEYEIVYITDISNSMEYELSNTFSYEFNGNGVKEDTHTEFKEVTYFWSGAGGQLERYNLSLSKEDADGTSLEGVKFGLFNMDGSVLLREGITDDKGNIDFGIIKWGTYILKETEWLDGYSNYFKVEGSDKFVSEYEFTTDTDQGIKITAINEKSGKIIIDKYAFGNDNEKLLGAEFNILKDGKVIDTIITDDKGWAESKPLPPGNYTLEEIKAPATYAKGGPYYVTLASGENKTVGIANEKLNQAVKLIKVDGEDNKPLPGVKFELYTKAGELVEYEANGEAPLNLVTDPTGEIVANNLPAGEYYFKEVGRPKYYLSPQNPKTEPFEIIENQKELGEPIVVKNTRGKGSIKVEKVDSADDTIKLEGVKFKISNESGTVVDKEGTTDENGVAIFKDLPYDTYTITEVETLETYVISKEPIEDIVLDGDENPVLKEITVKNDKKNRSVILTKYNMNKTLTLRGAVFELRKIIGDGEYEVITSYTVDELTTNGEGIINLDELGLGKYQLVEIKAPNGYRVDKTPIEFEIVEDQIAPKSVEMLNRRIPSDPDEPGGGGGGGPEDPKDPEDPEETEEPEDPVDPEEPVDPEDPQDPEEPTDPQEPVDPEDSVDPEEPIDPVEPTEPVEPPRYEQAQTPSPGSPGSPDQFILVDGDGVPLGKYTKKYNPDGTFVYVDEDGIPLGTRTNELVPQTGDRVPVLPLVLLFVTSALGALHLMIYKKKKLS